jgi:hypothetical protein
MLTLKDVKQICPMQRGTQLEGITIHAVSTNSETGLSKGLFVPLSLDNEENIESLKKALNNGAIATLWKKDEAVPAFLPTDFPVFFVEDYIESFEMVVKHYIDSYSMKRNETVHTQFLFSIPIKHSKKNDFYAKDINKRLDFLKTTVKNVIPSAVFDMKGGN